MASFVNKPCPCGSGKKYKKCCQVYHNGLNPKTALELMKSRYSAYAVGNIKYIVKTTHSQNKDFTEDTKLWEKSLSKFCQDTNFVKLDIIEFLDDEFEPYVTFKASLTQFNKDESFIEKSKFLKEDAIWKYHSGELE